MKQLFQFPSGETKVIEVPVPTVKPGHALVRNDASAVSVGTERMLLSFARKSLLEKARDRPDLVKKVVDKAARDGVLAAWDTVRSRLDEPVVPGYSSAGMVVDVGEGVRSVAPGDLVACAGAGYAVHGEVILVPENLVARVADGVEPEESAFATVGAIGLHGLRLADVGPGGDVAVIGLGLVGQLVVQMARAGGCRVLGFDLDPERVDLAQSLGSTFAAVTGKDAAVDPMQAVMERTGGRGVDAVIVAAATDSSGPVALAGELCRDRGTVVAVGAVGMEIPRRTFYEKELTFLVSRSYGPGRYDPSYEEGGVDYPVGYVRWTEGRNLEAFLRFLEDGAVRIEPLITHRFPISEAEKAYALLIGEGEGAVESTERSEEDGFSAPLGVVIRYPANEEGLGSGARRLDLSAPSAPVEGEVGIGLVGAGTFAMGTLIPAMEEAGGFHPLGVCTTTGTSARHAADRFNFAYACTDLRELLEDDAVELVVVATRHGSHARLVRDALAAGKHVFTEKPLCLDREELASVVEAREAGGRERIVAVGHNRRFSPMAQRLREFFAPVSEPLTVTYRVNGGFVERDHWIQDPGEGGGRIVGEGCHFVDFLLHLTGALPVRVRATGLPNSGRYADDNVTIVVELDDGSVGTVIYVAAGDPSLGKERCEIFGGGASAVLDDYRSLELVREGSTDRMRHWLRKRKGHREEWEALRRTLREGSGPPIPFQELVATSLVTFAAVESLRTGKAVDTDVAAFVDAVREDR